MDMDGNAIGMNTQVIWDTNAMSLALSMDYVMGALDRQGIAYMKAGGDADAADKADGALIAQKMEIVQEEIVGRFPGGKRPAELLHHAPGAGLVAREVECIQHVEPRVPEGVLRASP